MIPCDLKAKTRIKQNSDPQMEVFRTLTDASESKEPSLMARSERLLSIDSLRGRPETSTVSEDH